MNDLQMDHKERIREVDILRGFALLGICLVNVPEMFGKGLAFQSVFTGSDAFIRLLYDMFVQTKFYTLFAFLFGISFYLFMQSAERRGLSAKRAMSRRLLLLLLLVIGVAHGVLFWFGDILHTYAILGFFLLLFYKRTGKAILIWSLSLLSFSVLIVVTSSLLALMVAPEALNEPIFHGIPEWEERAGYLLNYSSLNLLWIGPEILGLFLLGLYAGKRGWFTSKGLSDTILRRLQWGSIFLSILLFIPMVNQYLSGSEYYSRYVYHYTFLTGKTMAIFYLCTLLRLIRVFGALRFNSFAACGQMAYTNYLTQTLITMLLFNLVWHDAGSWPLWANLNYALLLFMLQAGWSLLWLRHYNLGPLEWAWRTVTYLQLPPLRKKAAVSQD
ncbi:DUF418 domain-containing protein [Paenibacillus abyssi]|uniref:Membrane protein n=1 Tax=Paenibacillus abyssi TaxID=1340531 RepID=A0A917FYC1_9BACL|nr:DUF418 domain-containing protein [Paenibacillus abyssi]GGG14024.1 membrane protein [Paenibacillus abyssi]